MLEAVVYCPDCRGTATFNRQQQIIASDAAAAHSLGKPGPQIDDRKLWSCDPCGKLFPAPKGDDKSRTPDNTTPIIWCAKCARPTGHHYTGSLPRSENSKTTDDHFACQRCGTDRVFGFRGSH
jgi:DNA-directed RNA polymerase subunit RPC12/RpoP